MNVLHAQVMDAFAAQYELCERDWRTCAKVMRITRTVLSIQLNYLL